MIKVINIAYEHEPILSFLYPTYCITDSAALTSKFITHRTIRSKAEREALDFHYSEGIFISTQIFDEFWDEDKIKEECLKYSRFLGNRKKSFTTSKETFVEDCVKFIFSIYSEQEEEDILKLFDTYGSSIFPIEYFKLSNSIPVQKLNSSLFTFISKISKESTSVYYKKKAFVLEDKIKSNLTKAIDSFNLTFNDSVGVRSCKFFLDLVK